MPEVAAAIGAAVSRAGLEEVKLEEKMEEKIDVKMEEQEDAAKMEVKMEEQEDAAATDAAGLAPAVDPSIGELNWDPDEGDAEAGAEVDAEVSFFCCAHVYSTGSA